MPYLSKKFYATIDNFTKTSWTYNYGTGQANMDIRYLGEFVEHTKDFYKNLKTILQETTLSIIFDDEKQSFNIFGVDFFIKCIGSYSSSTFVPTYETIFPVIFMSRHYSTNSYINSLIHYINNGNFYGSNTNTKKPYDIKELGNNNPVNVGYGIKLYYNDNYIQCEWVGYTGMTFPLFFIAKSKCLANTDINPVYISASPNIYNYNTNYLQFNHFILIPEHNNDTSKTLDFLFNTQNIGYTENGYLFDKNMFARKEYMFKVIPQEELLNSVILKTVTSLGGILQFDNLFDITRESYNNSLNSAFPLPFVKGNFYEIDGEQYYYPGYMGESLNWFNGEQNMKILLKL